MTTFDHPSPRRAARRVGRWCLAAALLALSGCSDDADPHLPPAENFDLLGFSDEAGARGLVHVDRSGSPEKRTVLEANGPGVALVDLGPDGDWDVVFSGGAESLEALLAGRGTDLAPFENDGLGRFTPAAGPGLPRWWTGLAVGDLDQDGDGDLVAGAYGDLAVVEQVAGELRARPADATPFGARPGARLVAGEERVAGSAPDWVTSLALLDADRDGVLDLYVGRYLDLDPVAPPTGALGTGPLAVPCVWKGHEVYCGPRGMRPQADSLWRGDGRGGFVETAWLPDAAAGFTLAVHAFDADFDGDTDLYVANDSVANQFWINELATERAAFLELADLAGVALSSDGAPEAGMGVASGDVDGDGRLDLVLTNFSDEPTHLYLGADVGFDLATHRYGLGRHTRRLLSWGCHLADFDADGALELVQGNGHVYPQADLPGTGTSYGQPDSFFELANGVAAEPDEPWYRAPDSVFASATGTRGSAVGDVDGDGVPDLVLARIDGPAALGVARLNAAPRVLVVRVRGSGEPGPEGRRTPPDGQGTLVVLADGAGTQRREVRSSVGFQSASATDLYFAAPPDAPATYGGFELHFPSGRVERVGPGPWNRRLLVVEGSGVRSEEVL